MALSRRALIRSALATTAGVGMIAGGRAAFGAAPSPAQDSASGPGDVVGKITVGYQGWFACIGDEAPIHAWWHWAPDSQQAPSPTNTGIKSWPDVRDYSRTYPSDFPNLNDGRAAALFSSYDQQTVDTHFAWMRDNNIDTAALQRFNPFGSQGPTRDDMAQKVRQSAEATGRKFYIMYDVSGWTSMQSQIKDDWTSKMKAHTASGSYARQNGKPVVCIWVRLLRRQPALRSRALPGCRQLVQGTGLLCHRRRTHPLAQRQ